MRLPAKALAILSAFYLLLITNYLPALAADGTPPVSTATLTGTIGTNGWYTSTVAVNIQSDDLESGVKSITYSVDGAQSVENFGTASNLAPNPSFESGAIESWTVEGAASFSQDESNAKYGLRSAKIVSSDNGFKAWKTSSGISLTAGKTYVLSAWTKYSEVLGAGVKIFLDTASSTPLTGSSDWTRVYLIYIPASSGTFTPKLGIDGPGEVYFDGVYLSEGTIPAEVGFVVGSSGSHTVSFFSTNNDNVSEVSKSVSFKIDTQGPTNWRNLTSTNSGNDHTFTFGVDVSDNVSGLVTNTGEYQYSLDGGNSWGYHTDLDKCNSPWISDGWVQTSESPAGSGIPETRMTTPATDFCDSDFGSCEKKVRFRINDLAGNSSSKDYCLNSAWFQLQGGDVHSVGNISPSASSTSEWLVSSEGLIGNLTSSVSWYLPGYSNSLNLASLYDSWRSLYYGIATTLPGGKLPSTGSGYYKVIGDFKIDGNTLPSNLESQTVNAVIFIDGDLEIKSNFKMSGSSAYVFVVEDEVEIDGNVTEVAGYYFSKGEFDSRSSGPSNKELLVNGVAWAVGGFSLERDLGKSKNTGTPAERFVFPAKTFANVGLRTLLSGSTQVTWKEVSANEESCGG